MTIHLTRSARITAADPAEQAFLLLRTVFTVAPIVFGLDKFANVLTDWPQYLAPWIDRHRSRAPPSRPCTLVGVVEVVAGMLVAVAPRFGAWIVAAWLAGIIVNLLTIPGFYDVALRDFGLFVAAIALARLADRHATDAPPPGAARDRRPTRCPVARARPAPGGPQPRRRRPAGRGAGGRRPARALGPGPGGRTSPTRPRRVADAYAELLTPPPFDLTTFPNDEGYDELVLARGIPVQSLCEHHLLPFIGVAHVGYLPGERILGLSKLARVRRAVRPRPAGPGAAHQAGRRLAAGPAGTRAASAS